MADGSKLFLDVDTQVQVRYAERTRDVLLKKGEVFFVVSHDPARPFRVGSGDSRVTVLGTQFSVRRNAQALAVAVKQGARGVAAVPGEGCRTCAAGWRQRAPGPRRPAPGTRPCGAGAGRQLARWATGVPRQAAGRTGGGTVALSCRADPPGRSPACRQAGLRYGADRPPRRFSPRSAGAIAGAGTAAGWR
ncbi:FecR domain-containing protein [Pseudomonas aeruginosa]